MPASRLGHDRRRAPDHPAAVKAACALAGDATGPVRAPLLPLGEPEIAELARLIERATLAGAVR